MCVVHVLITDRVPYPINAGHLVGIAVLLGINKDIKIDVKHILLGPHLEAVAGTVGAVMSGRSYCQRYLVFIVVVLHVRTDADEHRDVTIAQVALVADRCLVVDEHLQTFIGAQVKFGVTVNATGITSIKVINGELHGLLVELGNLGLATIDDT